MGGSELLLFLHLSALYDGIASWLFVRDAGRTLTHMDRPLGTAEGRTTICGRPTPQGGGDPMWDGPDPRSFDPREPGPTDPREAEALDPRDALTSGLDLLCGRVGERVDVPEHEYELRCSEARALATIGTCRVVPASDFHDDHGRPWDLRHGDPERIVRRVAAVESHRRTSLVAPPSADVSSWSSSGFRTLNPLGGSMPARRTLAS